MNDRREKRAREQDESVREVNRVLFYLVLLFGGCFLYYGALASNRTHHPLSKVAYIFDEDDQTMVVRAAYGSSRTTVYMRKGQLVERWYGFARGPVVHYGPASPENSKLWQDHFRPEAQSSSDASPASEQNHSN